MSGHLFRSQRHHAEGVVAGLIYAFETEAWRDEGFESYLAYCEALYDGLHLRLPIDERREKVAELTEKGASTREVGAALGVDHATAARDVLAVADATEQAAIDAEEGASTVADATDQPDTPPEPLTPGWHELGDHRLYCGDSTDDEFITACAGTAFAFADPPYNAGKADWDTGFTWNHDYLADTAAIVAVTPGIAALAGFLGTTDMPYRWTMAAEITNGMTAGALRFGNWIAVPLFAHGSIYRQAKDHVRIPAATTDDRGGTHPSRKPLRLLTHLIDLFTTRGDTVLDPFLGSGTTLLAAERAGRSCIGAELDPTTCAEIVHRYEAMDT